MTTFEDGPAKGKHLMLKRCPIFLRVVAERESFDALDQPSDTAKETESIFAYKVQGEVGMCHINAGRGKSGWYPIANYKFIKEQPTDEEMRDSAKWREWVERNKNI